MGQTPKQSCTKKALHRNVIPCTETEFFLFHGFYQTYKAGIRSGDIWFAGDSMLAIMKHNWHQVMPLSCSGYILFSFLSALSPPTGQAQQAICILAKLPKFGWMSSLKLVNLCWAHILGLKQADYIGCTFKSHLDWSFQHKGSSSSSWKMFHISTNTARALYFSGLIIIDHKWNSSSQEKQLFSKIGKFEHSN